MSDARISRELDQWIQRLDVAPPGREKQVKALKKTGVENPFAVAWASYDKSKKKHKDAPTAAEEAESVDDPDEEQQELDCAMGRK